MFTRLSRRDRSRTPVVRLRPLSVCALTLLTISLFALSDAQAQSTESPPQSQQAAPETDARDNIKVPQVVVTAPDALKKAKAALAKSAQATEAPIVPVTQEIPAIQSQNTPTGLQNPAGQTVTNLDSSRSANVPVFSIGDVLKESPGISIKQGNGPRDVYLHTRIQCAQRVRC